MKEIQKPSEEQRAVVEHYADLKENGFLVYYEDENGIDMHEVRDSDKFLELYEQGKPIDLIRPREDGSVGYWSRVNIGYSHWPKDEQRK